VTGEGRGARGECVEVGEFLAVKWRKKIVIGLVVLVVGAGLWFPNAVRTAGLRQMGLWLDVGTTRPEPVDYVLSLGGGEEIRPFVGAALVKVGLAERALVVQTVSGPNVQDGIDRPTHEIIRDVYLARGVPRERLVFLDGSSSTTFDESLAARRFFEGEDRPVSLAVVTHHFHTRRARWVFRQVLGDLPVRLVMVSAPCEDFRLETWWTSKRGFITVGAEYLRLGFYEVWYGNEVWWLLGVAGIVGWLFWRCRRSGKKADGNRLDNGEELRETPQRGGFVVGIFVCLA